MPLRILRTALVVTLAIFGQEVRAQTSADSTAARIAPVHARCRDPHPLPTCGSYLLLEVMGTQRLAGGRSDTPGCFLAGVPCIRTALPGWLAWDIGFMKNANQSRAFGASFEIGGSEEGVRIAAKARHRSWYAHDFVLDASAGPLMTQLQSQASSNGVRETYGATADIGIGRARIGLVTIGGDFARQMGRNASAAHGGIRLESRGMAIASGVIAIGALALISALGSAGY